MQDKEFSLFGRKLLKEHYLLFLMCWFVDSENLKHSLDWKHKNVVCNWGCKRRRVQQEGRMGWGMRSKSKPSLLGVLPSQGQKLSGNTGVSTFLTPHHWVSLGPHLLRLPVQHNPQVNGWSNCGIFKGILHSNKKEQTTQMNLTDTMLSEKKLI